MVHVLHITYIHIINVISKWLRSNNHFILYKTFEIGRDSSVKNIYFSRFALASPKLLSLPGSSQALEAGLS